MLISNTRRSVLASCCGAHAIQDGLVALQFVLLPILAQSIGLNYAQVGMLRAISNTSMSLLELPSGILAERFGERRLLAIGLVTAGLGYIGVALAPNFFMVALFFLIAGAGSGFQHSLASSLVVKNFTGPGRRKAMGTYNSLGDGGKLSYTAIFSLGIGAGFAWNAVVAGLAIVSVIFGGMVWFALRGMEDQSLVRESAESAAKLSRWGIIDQRRFAALGLMVFLDSTVQAVFLTFLAFVLLEKGADAGLASAAVVLALAGGMVGKFCCGFIAVRLGDRWAFILLQILTIVGIAALIVLPAGILYILLPLIGLVVQGSSTVTYGSIADLIDQGRQSRGFALIYSVSTAASVVGTFVFGLIADHEGLTTALWILALVVVVTLPFGLTLAGNQAKAVTQ